MNNYKNFLFKKDQIGSDEVGTGDFFAPIVVAAVLVEEKKINEILKNEIKDSKKISDSKILKIGDFIIKNYPYSFKILSNEKFNQIKKNMVEIKCLLHNKLLFDLHLKYPKINSFCIDQFVNKEKYYEYLKKNNIKNILENVIFKTKGETYFPSVAAASIVARYFFIKEIDKINQKYNTKIPLGAVYKNTDQFAIDFIRKNGIDEFNKIVKMKFKNYKRILNLTNLTK